MPPDATERTAVVLFSGGTASTLTAIRTGRLFDRVHLLTFTRRGLSGQEHVTDQARRLARFFGDQQKFVQVFISTNRLCRKVMYESYWKNWWRHGFMVLSHCGLCQVSFHWRAIVYCLENKLEHLADGAVRTANVYPERIEAAMLGHFRELYASFGIEYLTPIYEEEKRVEEILYQLRYNRTPKIEGTAADRKMICRQQVLNNMFLRACLPRMLSEQFEQRMAAFYRGKFGLVEEWTREWLARGPESRLARLLE